MILVHLKPGDILWGSRNYDGNLYEKGKDDTAFIVIKSDGDAVQAVVGSENPVGTKVNVQYKTYYFDFDKVENVPFEFIYRYVESAEGEAKIKAVELATKGYIESKKDDSTTYTYDPSKDENVSLLSAYNSANRFDVIKGKARSRNVGK